MPERALVKWAGIVSVLQGLLIFIPTFVLGAAIDWPDSLEDPASISLPRLLENEGAVRAGYFAYLIYSILFLISIALLSEVVFGKNAGILMRIIIGLAAASALARTLGITRWLAPMFDLAALRASATTDEERYAIDVTFSALNSYGGTIGEVLGVGIFAAIAILLLSVGNISKGTLPRWFSIFGIVSAIGLFWSASEIIGIDPGDGAVFYGTTIVQFWFLAAGVYLLTRGQKVLSNR
jgi:hypothetical protein